MAGRFVVAHLLVPAEVDRAEAVPGGGDPVGQGPDRVGLRPGGDAGRRKILRTFALADIARRPPA